MITKVDRLELVRRWKHEIAHAGYVPLQRSDVDDQLADCLEHVLGELACPDRAGEARQAGADLVPLHFTSPAMLSRSLKLLALELPELLPEVAPERLFGVLGEFAAGFAGKLREKTVDEQEVVLKHAVGHTRQVGDEALRASRARFDAVFDSAALGVALAGTNGVITEANPALGAMFGRDPGELVGVLITDLADQRWRAGVTGALAELAAGAEDRAALDVRYTLPDDSELWTRISPALVRDAQGEPDYLVLLYEDITHRHLLQEQFRRQAVQDPLTGLANRTQLESCLHAALTPVYPGRRVGLCLFDLDGFKAVNDSLGHRSGNGLLREVARRLRVLAAPDSAVVARTSGDEFAVVIPDSIDATAVIDLVERLLAEITRPIRIGQHELTASASVGIVEREVVGTDADALLRDADITLYRAKRDGRALWVLYDPERNAREHENFRLSAALPAALQSNELFVEYEPVLDVPGGSVIAAAATVRWDHPELGELGAERFAGLAEETGLLTRLGGWTLEQAGEHAARWVGELGRSAPLVAVTLSARHCREPDLVREVRDVLARTGLPAESLVLCLPESALFDHQGDPVDTLEIFAELGIRLFVHEFGSRYTRVDRLRDLPLAGVRLDGPFLSGLADPGGADPLSEHLVSSAVGAARLLELPVLAAGVEHERQAARLVELGVSMIQGPYVGDRLSAGEIGGFVTGRG
ncbi:putative bifunctional diguanylate cyclase/phosphodiesterase [Saccharopolyspora griseoalba]|uniref:Bifunctional diguanylate cyclase/phosphodiesterase n=1 Tax=Saccharopolyspora griseoalba TaxID=1431848 RepID=A0ABW2LSV7_9PSEU